MRSVLILMSMTVMFAAQTPSRPWIQGSVEKGCALTPAALARLKKEKPNVVIEECHCQHTCDPSNEHADETGGVAWDGRCVARCSPSNCACPDPFDS